MLATDNNPLVQVKLPVVLTCSFAGEPFTRSTDNVPAPEKLTAPVFNTPCVVVPVPGAMVPPALTEIVPATVPAAPPSVAPLATVTALVASVEPVTSTVPTLTVVAPV